MDILNKWNLLVVLLFCRQCRLELTTGYKYLGCFINHFNFEMLSKESHTDPLLTPERCFARCSRQSHRYFMLRSGTICACFEVLHMKNYNSNDECHLLCKGDTLQTCGGENSVEIFRVYYCPRLQRPVHGYLIQNLSTAWFHCSEGYQLEGPNVIYCNTSTQQWNGSTNPFCKDTHNGKNFSLSTISWNEDKSESSKDLQWQRIRHQFVIIFLVAGWLALILICIVITRKYFSLKRSKNHGREKQRRQSGGRNQECYSNESATSQVDCQQPFTNEIEDVIELPYYNKEYDLVNR